MSGQSPAPAADVPPGPDPGSAVDLPAGGAYLAAIDLGSNSFHMLIARLLDGEPVVMDRIREPVQLAFGLDADGRIAAEAGARALDTLRRFGQRIRHIPAGQVRAVGTNTLRRAKNARGFLGEAETALGHGIEIVSGREEARLVYLGVAHSLPDELEPRLVVDIGGGSTELILGERFEPFEVHSLHMGCISWTQEHLPGGTLKKKALDRAVLAARAEIQTIERRFRDLGWGRAVGSSGTVRALDEIVRTNGWGDALSPAGLKRVKKALVDAGQVDQLRLPGLKPERLAVIGGGWAILAAVFEALEIDRMEASTGALREGLMYDLLGRIRHEDVRERTIRLFQERYQVDHRQAARVERSALELLRQAAANWRIDFEEASRFLTWGAKLHEVGLAVSYVHHHLHGAYLIANSDLPGFSRGDQDLLAAIVGGHRRKLSPDPFEALPRERRDLARHLTVLLRLAVLANREHGPRPLAPFRLEGLPDGLRIVLPRSWLERNPLTTMDFDAERGWLKKVGFRLEVVGVD